jgi:hypothetical protein
MASPLKQTRLQPKKILWGIPLHVNNMKIFAIGLCIIIVGFVMLSTGIYKDEATYLETWDNPMSTIVAPILLVIGYCVVIPYALMMKSKDTSSEQ